MRELVSGENVTELFNLLNDEGIEFVLLRNFNDELPDNLTTNKDIDIIVKPNNIKLLRSVLKKNNWKEVRHPWDFGNNFIFLYSMNPFLFYRKDGIYLDICFQLTCRSLNQGEWFPLDEEIQKSVWINKKEVPESWKHELSNEDFLVHLITRSIFDKKEFTSDYRKAIENTLYKTDKNELNQKLELIFFKFTKVLMSNLYSKDYDEIRNKYLQFSNY